MNMMIRRLFEANENEDKYLWVSKFSYDSPNDPKPEVYALGSWVHPNTNNTLLIGVNRHYFESDISGQSNAHDSVPEIIMALQAAIEKYPMKSADTRSGVRGRVRDFRKWLSYLSGDEQIFGQIFRYYYVHPEFMKGRKDYRVPFRTEEQILRKEYEEEEAKDEAQIDVRASDRAADSVIKNIVEIPVHKRERVKAVLEDFYLKAAEYSKSAKGMVLHDDVKEFFKKNWDKYMRSKRIPVTWADLDKDPDFFTELQKNITDYFYKHETKPKEEVDAYGELGFEEAPEDIIINKDLEDAEERYEEEQERYKKE